MVWSHANLESRGHTIRVDRPREVHPCDRDGRTSSSGVSHRQLCVSSLQPSSRQDDSTSTAFSPDDATRCQTVRTDRVPNLMSWEMRLAPDWPMISQPVEDPLSLSGMNQSSLSHAAGSPPLTRPELFLRPSDPGSGIGAVRTFTFERIGGSGNVMESREAKALGS
jgi:hypothetical protein